MGVIPGRKKPWILTVIGLVILIASLIAVKGLQIRAMADQAKNFVPPPETVTSTVVKGEAWEIALKKENSPQSMQHGFAALEKIFYWLRCEHCGRKEFSRDHQ